MNVNRREFLISASTATAAVSISRGTVWAADAKRYTACIIGDSKQGNYGHYLHLAFALRDDVTVVGLADPDPKGRARYAAEAGAQRTYADYREMLERERPDLVVLGPRWTVHHRDYLLACAEAGAHGIIEKPLCVDLAEADEMLAAVERKNLKWAIAFNLRPTPIIQHVRKMMWEEHVIGTILEVRGRGKEDHRAGGEDLIVLGSHVFDMMMFLLNGLPAACSADILSGGRHATPADVHDPTEGLGPVVGDSIHAYYRFGGGVAGYFDTVKNPDGSQGRYGLDVYGSRGIISIRFGTLPAVYWLDDPTWAPGGRAREWKPLPGMPEFALGDEVRERNKAIVDDLITAIEQDRAPAVSLEDGRNVQEMIQAVYESHIQGRPVTLPLEERVHPLKRWRA